MIRKLSHHPVTDGSFSVDQESMKEPSMTLLLVLVHVLFKMHFLYPQRWMADLTIPAYIKKKNPCLCISECVSLSCLFYFCLFDCSFSDFFFISNLNTYKQ